MAKKSKRKKRLWILALLIFIFLLLLMLGGKRGFIQQLRLRYEKKVLEQEIEVLEEKKEQLETEKERERISNKLYRPGGLGDKKLHPNYWGDKPGYSKWR